MPNEADRNDPLGLCSDRRCPVLMLKHHWKFSCCRLLKAQQSHSKELHSAVQQQLHFFDACVGGLHVTLTKPATD